MSLNITAIWEALFDTAPSGAQLSFFEAEDASQGDAATIKSIIGSSEVQSVVIPVIQIIQLATGLAPNPSQLANWVAAADSEGLLAVAEAWVSNSNFQAQYGTTSTSIINGIYAKAFGIVPSAQQVAAWSVDSPAQILLAFATSTQYTNTLANEVNTYLADVINAVSGEPGAVFPSGSLTSLPTTTIDQTLTLTTGSDTVISGQGFDGGTTVVLGTGGVEINAPLVPPSGGQLFSQPTLQNGDVIQLTGTGNILDATFAPIDTGATVTFGPPWLHVTVPIPGPDLISTPIQGVQTWNLTAADIGTYVAINGGANVSGVTTINDINSAPDSYIRVGVGGPGFAPLSAPVTTLGASNDGAGGELQVVVQASAMTAADAVAVTVNLDNVGAQESLSSSYSAQDFPAGSIDGSFEVSEGPNQGWINTADGVTSWTLDVSGSNYLYLGTNGSEAATSVTINGTAGSSLTLWGSGSDWSKVTTIDASGFLGSNLILTGAMDPSGDGFLSDPANLTSFQGGGTTEIVDLSGLSLAGLEAMTLLDGGSGTSTTLILANDVLDHISAPLPTGLTDWTVIGDAGSNGPGSDHAGTIDWADLETNADALTFYGGLFFGTLTVDSAPNSFTVNLQDNNFDHVNFAFNAVNDVFGASNTLTINFGCSTDDAPSTDVNGHWTVTGYDTIILDSMGDGQSANDGADDSPIGDFSATPVLGGTITLDVQGNGDISIGNVTAVTAGEVGTPTVSIDGGSIIGSNSGWLWLGITDASSIDDSAGGGLYMSGPDSDTSLALTVTGSAADFNLLQGSLGKLVFGVNAGGADYGVAGAATINGGSDGDHIFDTGGVTTIDLTITPTAGDGDHIFYAAFSLNADEYPGTALAIDNNLGEYGFGPGLHTPYDNGFATIDNFIAGGGSHNDANDIVFFNVDSWGSGGTAHYNGNTGIYVGLVTSQADPVSTVAPGPAVLWTVDAAGTLPTFNGTGQAIDLVVFDPHTTYSDGTLESAINGGTASFIAQSNFSGNAYSMLFAFNNGDGTTIADVQFNNVSGDSAVHVLHVQDLVDLVGVATTALTSANVHFTV